MCLATVYLETEDKKQELMRDVAWVRPQESGLEFITLLGTSRLLHAKIKSIDLMHGSIVVEGMGPVIRHNSFVNIPSSAIRLATLDALVELNYFHNCVYESGDQGAIDVFGNPLYRGKVDDGISFANIDGNENFHGTSPESIKPFVLPWHPIPVDHIGPYDSNRGNK